MAERKAFSVKVMSLDGAMAVRSSAANRRHNSRGSRVRMSPTPAVRRSDGALDDPCRESHRSKPCYQFVLAIAGDAADAEHFAGRDRKAMIASRSAPEGGSLLTERLSTDQPRQRRVDRVPAERDRAGLNSLPIISSASFCAVSGAGRIRRRPYPAPYGRACRRGAVFCPACG